MVLLDIGSKAIMSALLLFSDHRRVLHVWSQGTEWMNERTCKGRGVWTNEWLSHRMTGWLPLFLPLLLLLNLLPLLPPPFLPPSSIALFTPVGFRVVLLVSTTTVTFKYEIICTSFIFNYSPVRCHVLSCVRSPDVPRPGTTCSRCVVWLSLGKPCLQQLLAVPTYLPVEI